MVVKVENVSLVIKKQTILEQINITCKAGCSYGFIGRNGSGKTMLMRCICGFVKPTSGKIYTFGKELGKDVDFIPDAGIIIETPGFYQGYSGYKNLKLLAGIRNRITDKDIKYAMELVGLDSESKQSVRKYSLGMRQRLGIAQAIMESPKILILDEPFNGLDKQGVQEMRGYLNNLKQTGKTIIMASHSMEDIEQLCDIVYEMDHGKMTRIYG